MADIVSTKYKLRAGSPMPALMENNQTKVTSYVIQTFGVEKQIVHNDAAKTVLLQSKDIQGQGGPYASAQYQQKAERIIDGTGGFGATVFQASELERIVENLDESEMAG